MMSTLTSITVVALSIEKKVRSDKFYRPIVHLSSLRTNPWSALILAKLIVYAYGVHWLYCEYFGYANFMGILFQGSLEQWVSTYFLRAMSNIVHIHFPDMGIISRNLHKCVEMFTIVDNMLFIRSQ